jgi:site-specific DNA-methyltransferase (adenine-specific)
VTPYYDDGTVTIYHGDCREVMDDLAATALVTDPPYGTGAYATDAKVFTPRLLRHVVDTWPVAIFGWPEKLVRLCVDAVCYPDEWVTWWPTNGAIRGTNTAGLWRESEVVAVFGRHRFAELRQARTISSGRILAAAYQGVTGRGRVGLSHGVPDERRVGDVWTDAAPGLAFQSHQRLHPNEKPLSIMHRLVEGMSEPGQTVADIFCGSGTTLRAAKDLGRRAIGIEIEERYCEIAAKRCAQEVLL